MERTISGMMGKGSVNHNTRAFSAKNVDKERSRDNVEFCHKDIKAVYHELFDEALERYNAKQKRSDRKIDNYYEKIRQGKQEKLFYEVIFQIGNRDDMNARSEEGQLAKQILIDFMTDFQSRNPNLHVTGSKRGLDTRVSLKGALAEQGFEGGTRGATEWNQWIESEKKELAAVMERYGVEWLQKGTHNKHLSVLDYEKQERAKEVAELDSQLAQSERALQTVSKMVDSQLARAEELAEMGDKFQKRNEEIKADNAELEEAYIATKQSYNSLSAKNNLLITENEDLEQEKKRRLSSNRELEKQQQKLKNELEAMAGSKVALERNVRAYDEDRQWQLPEPGVVQSAKVYREKVALPLITRLKELVKNLTIKCVGLMEQVKKLTAKVNQQGEDIAWYKNKIKEQNSTMEHLQEKAEDLERVKQYVGADKIQDIIDNVKEAERLQAEQKRLQRSCQNRVSR